MKTKKTNKVKRADKLTEAERTVWDDILAGVRCVPGGRIQAAQMDDLSVSEKRRILAELAAMSPAELAEMDHIGALPLPEMEKAILPFLTKPLSERLERTLDLLVPPGERSN